VGDDAVNSDGSEQQADHAERDERLPGDVDGCEAPVNLMAQGVDLVDGLIGIDFGESAAQILRDGPRRV
jgi:hypothetical protein